MKNILLIFMSLFLLTACSQNKTLKPQNLKKQNDTTSTIKVKKKPATKAFSAPIIKVDKVSRMSQKELDYALERLFHKDSMKDEYSKAIDLLSQGAFVTKKALYNTIQKEVKDYRSFQLLYLNGGFDKTIFKNKYGRYNCDFLEKAVEIDYLTSYQNLEKEITSSVQTALFLKDKVDFSACKGKYGRTYFSELAGNRYNFQMSLDTLKIIVTSKNMAENLLNSLVPKIYNNSSANWTYKENKLHLYFKPRIEIIKFLQSKGAKVSTENIAKYINLYRNPISNIRNSSMQRTALNYYQEGLKLISKDLKGLDKTLDNALRNMKNQSQKRYSKPIEKEMYSKTVDILSNESNTNIIAKQSNDDMLTQLRTAIFQKDKRRITFYLRRGAKPSSGILYLTAQNKLSDTFFNMLKINEPKDLNYERLVYISANKEVYDIFDFIVENRPIKNNLEDTVIKLIENEEISRAKKLINKGVNVNKIIDSIYYNHGINSSKLYNAQKITGIQGQKRFNYFKKVEIKKEKERIKAAKLKEQKRQKELARAQAEYSRIKKIGDKVCRTGTQLFILDFKIVGYVENVKGDKIQIRISRTGGYTGKDYQERRLVWDPYWNWRVCR